MVPLNSLDQEIEMRCNMTFLSFNSGVEMVLYIVSLNSLGQNDWNEVQYYFFHHVMPLAFMSCYADGIITGNIKFLIWRQLLSYFWEVISLLTSVTTPPALMESNVSSLCHSFVYLDLRSWHLQDKKNWKCWKQSKIIDRLLLASMLKLLHQVIEKY